MGFSGQFIIHLFIRIAKKVEFEIFSLVKY